MDNKRSDSQPKLGARTIVDLRPMARQVGARSLDSIRQAIPRQSVRAGLFELNPFLLLLGARALQLRLHQRYQWLSRFEYPVIVVTALAMAYSPDVGQGIVLAYGLFALVFRLDGRQPWLIAIVLLAATPIFQLLGLNSIAENASIYAFEFMVVGVVCAITNLPKNHP